MTIRIKELREQENLYQRNLAEFIGCTQQTYSRYETEELEPSLKVLEKLARFYNTSVDYILGFTDVREPNWSEENLNGAAAVEAANKKADILSQPKVKRGRKPKNPTAE
ncbi:MAG: helix-turn-helix transcriptional regulator [Oscillospiraceae bacterium]|nr:helix-turn-helix transcriptional regulator [Oscillospiraceae bacterium]